MFDFYLKDVQNLQQAAWQQANGGNWIFVRAALSCKHSRALLPVHGFTS